MIYSTLTKLNPLNEFVFQQYGKPGAIQERLLDEQVVQLLGSRKVVAGKGTTIMEAAGFGSTVMEVTVKDEDTTVMEATAID